MSCGGGHLGFPIGIKNTHLVEDLPMIIPGQFGFNCPSGFTLVTNKGEHSNVCSKETNIDTVERGEKMSNAVKGAISLNR